MTDHARRLTTLRTVSLVGFAAVGVNLRFDRLPQVADAWSMPMIAVILVANIMQTAWQFTESGAAAEENSWKSWTQSFAHSRSLNDRRFRDPSPSARRRVSRAEPAAPYCTDPAVA